MRIHEDNPNLEYELDQFIAFGHDLLDSEYEDARYLELLNKQRDDLFDLELDLSAMILSDLSDGTDQEIHDDLLNRFATHVTTRDNRDNRYANPVVELSDEFKRLMVELKGTLFALWCLAPRCEPQFSRNELATQLFECFDFLQLWGIEISFPNEVSGYSVFLHDRPIATPTPITWWRGNLNDLLVATKGGE